MKEGSKRVLYTLSRTINTEIGKTEGFYLGCFFVFSK